MDRRRFDRRARDGRVRLYFADQLPLLAPGWEQREPPDGELHDAIREQLALQGASFWGQIRGRPRFNEQEILTALWDLVWSGEVTNDTLGSAAGGARRAQGQGDDAPARPSDRPRSGRGPVGSRGSARRRARAGGASSRRCSNRSRRPTEAAHAPALQLLERYGVVTREAVLAEGVVGGFARCTAC